MNVSAIVVAAGRGLRLGQGVSKPLIMLGHKPLIIHSLEILNRHPDIREIILVANPGNLSRLVALVDKYRIKKAAKIVLGGSERRDSVASGLKALSRQAGLVLIHDAARPFISRKVISAAVRQAAKAGAAIVGVPVKATIKKAKSLTVEKTIDRSGLWEIQTPQVFKRQIILEAYKRFGKTPATDDAMLVEKSGRQVRIVMGSYDNIKITTPEDLIIAQVILERQSK